MNQIKADKAYSKEFDGKNGKWMKYSIKSGDKWYTLKGANAKYIKEGDTVIGEVEERDWEANGKTGTEYILVLIDPMTASIIKRIEYLETMVESLTGGELDQIKVAKNKNNDDLPF